MPTADRFEWPEGTPLFETEWRALSEALAGNGIVAPGDLQVTATATDLEIQVAAGSVWYTGSETTLGAAETHTLSSGGTDDRWDTVFFDTATGSSGVREGTASASPEPPDIAGDEVLLAVVYVEAGATNVTDSEIHNWRSQRPGAERIQYDDSPGVYGTATVDGALDELQEAAQASAYPFALATDTDMDVAGTDLTDSTVPQTIWDASVPGVPNAALANASLTYTAGDGLKGGGSVALGGSATINIEPIDFAGTHLSDDGADNLQVDEDFVLDPGTTAAGAPGFGTWTQVSASRPAWVEIEVAPETDGTSDAIITIEVDESGGTTADYSFTARTIGALASGDTEEEFFKIYLPAGAQYQIVNTSDPNAGNAINTVREIVG